MDSLSGNIKQENLIASSSSYDAPQPMEGLYEVGPPPFLTKIYDIVDDASSNEIVSWSSACNSFVVWDPHAFSMSMLPKYFKHGNFSSFVRQLNTYGFKKVDPDKWEFANEGFLKGQKHLLKSIKRRRAPPNPPHKLKSMNSSLEIGNFALDGEINMLKRDKSVLMAEVIKLRQEQQNTRDHIQAMEERVKETEKKQQQMMTFIARAMRNPDFLQQLRSKELEEAIMRKRRRPIELETSNVEPEELLEIEGQEMEYLDPLGANDLEGLDVEIEGLNDDEVEGLKDNEELQTINGYGDSRLFDEFWKGLMSDEDIAPK